MQEWWQHLPQEIDPIVFTVGFFSLHWYAVSWLVGLSLAWAAALWYREHHVPSLSREGIADLFLVLFLGALLGGHLGYLFFYRPDILITDPVGFWLPFDATGAWAGISGMSFHGGLIGVIIALLWFVRKNRLPFFAVADLVSLVAPLALFFGRIGNFLALELYGRTTMSPLGMYFPGAPGATALCHPSALYEALGEGALLFFFLYWVGKQVKLPGTLSALFLIGYGAIRFLLEWFREPDPGLPLVGGVLTQGQWLSLVLIICGGALLLWLRRKNYAKIGG